MQEMLRKKFKLSLEFFGPKGTPKNIDFFYEQGSLRELLEIQNKLDDPEELSKWLFDFLMKKTTQSDKLTLELFKQLPAYRINDIIEFILKTYGKNFFKKIEHEDKRMFQKKIPDSSMICFILQNTSETMETLLNMTWEQIEYIIEGVAWNINSQSKKGKQRNEQMMRMKELEASANPNEENDKIKRLKEKIDQRKNLKK